MCEKYLVRYEIREISRTYKIIGGAYDLISHTYEIFSSHVAAIHFRTVAKKENEKYNYLSFDMENL